ncbi:hypothetical protein [uncultured Draconibacterium sp.]|uniref:hypothetical protein n=1 Tax=uncultured Draconibacterium sp. TaxID=1573823 RepID=UPI0032607559
MKRYIFFLILPLFIACSPHKSVKSNHISQFEAALGETETTFLDEMVYDFERFLEKKYGSKNSTSNLKTYLKALSDGSAEDIWEPGEELHTRYLPNRLFASYDSIYPDSVWIEDGFVNLLFEGSEIEESIIPIDKKEIHSLANELRNEPRRIENDPGTFYPALGTIAANDSLVSSFLDYKAIAGNTSLHLLASGLLHNYDKSCEYFIKRILVMELNP